MKGYECVVLLRNCFLCEEVRTMCMRSYLKHAAIQSPTLGDSMTKTQRFAERCSALYFGVQNITQQQIQNIF